MKKRILHLTLKKEPFDQIAKELKKKEYREIKPYWMKRFFNADGTVKEFDEIHFRNGYRKDSPFMRVEWKGFNRYVLYNNQGCYAIQLGKILELRNYESVVFISP